MNLTVTLRQLLAVQSGEGKNGPWKKQDLIVETDGQYPKKICVTVWGDKLDLNRFNPGDAIEIFFDVESREFNGRWYTDVKAWKIEPAGGGSSAAQAEADYFNPPQRSAAKSPAKSSPREPIPPADDDDLPF